jgi:ubiquitin-activating enzyme E1
MHFQEYFHNRVAQLTYTFPEEVTTSQGALFWSAPKRFPRPLNFDTADEVHMQFVRAAANLKAEVHGLKVPALTDAELGALITAIHVDPFQPKAGVKFETNPKVVCLCVCGCGCVCVKGSVRVLDSEQDFACNVIAPY